MEKYFNELIDYVKTAERSIYIVDYGHPYQGRVFEREYQKYFNAIENHLKSRDKGFRYKRIHQIPVCQTEKNKINKIKILVSGFLDPTVKHIKKSFSLPVSFDLHVVNCRKLFCFMIIDEEILLNKYDKYTDGVPELDEIYVTVDKDVLKNRLALVKELSGNNKVTLELLKHAYSQIPDKSKKIKNHEKEILKPEPA